MWVLKVGFLNGYKLKSYFLKVNYKSVKQMPCFSRPNAGPLCTTAAQDLIYSPFILVEITINVTNY